MLIILDRDGVINEDSADYIKSPEEWHAIAGSLEAIAKLNRAGHHVVIASNQSGVGRGYYTLETLEKIHEKFQRELKAVGGHIDGIFICPHHPDEQCQCRKPKPGLFQQIAEKFSTDFKNALAVGDSLRDIQAAQAVSCPVVLVKTGNGVMTLQKQPHLPIPVYENLAALVDDVLTKQ